MLKCIFCGTNLNWNCDYDAQDVGYDCEGIVGCYLCMNNECNTMYDMINLFPDENSEDYYVYGDRFIKFYEIEEDY